MKVFHEEVYRNHGIELAVSEEYFSTSTRGVLRGFHFQVPPADHDKLVYAVEGTVLDVVVDLRASSDTYGKVDHFELRGEVGGGVFVPRGFGHAFFVLSERATLVYKTSSIYDPSRDRGILWSSVDFAWPTSEPNLSNRDASFPALDEFVTPFR